MYRFTRTATIANAAYIPQAMNLAMDLCGYINKTHNLNVKAGMEMYGHLNIHWQFETDSLDKISAINTKLLQDKGYFALIEKGKDYWVQGSLKDRIVNFMG